MHQEICDGFLVTLQRLIDTCNEHNIDLTENFELHDKFLEFVKFLDETGAKPKWQDYPEVSEQFVVWKEQNDASQDTSWMFDGEPDDGFTGL